jgi:hypothetical protein
MPIHPATRFVDTAYSLASAVSGLTRSSVVVISGHDPGGLNKVTGRLSRRPIPNRYERAFVEMVVPAVS